MRRSGNKYRNVETHVNGIKFDSRREAMRYTQLLLLLRLGEISDLELQKEYELIPAQYEVVESTETYKRGVMKGKPNQKRVCVEHAVKYIADFVYKDTRTGQTVVEDAKGKRTEKYLIKRKLMLYLKGIKIKEV